MNDKIEIVVIDKLGTKITKFITPKDNWKKILTTNFQSIKNDCICMIAIDHTEKILKYTYYWSINNPNYKLFIGNDFEKFSILNLSNSNFSNDITELNKLFDNNWETVFDKNIILKNPTFFKMIVGEILFLSPQELFDIYIDCYWSLQASNEFKLKLFNLMNETLTPTIENLLDKFSNFCYNFPKETFFASFIREIYGIKKLKRK